MHQCISMKLDGLWLRHIISSCWMSFGLIYTMVCVLFFYLLGLVGRAPPDFKKKSFIFAYTRRFKVRVVEQSTEGVHSQLSRIIRKAPSAKLSFLSMEIRFPLLVDFALRYPVVPVLHCFWLLWFYVAYFVCFVFPALSGMTMCCMCVHSQTPP